jgi:hypothetical protein
MKSKITRVTKRDVFNLFNNGIDNNSWLIDEVISYPYYGRIEEIDFIKRLYNLKNIKSNDDRLDNAEGDIWQHTVNNDDYSRNWIFEDERFGLLEGDDKIFLDFLCEIFHPEVRDENGEWRLFFDKINELIKKDDYQLYVSDTISSREVYSWKRYSPEDDIFTPFSERNKALIENRTIQLKIPRQARYQICQAINSYNDSVSEVDSTGWRTDTDIKEISLRELQNFYVPRAYNKDGKYTEVDNIEDFIQNTSPYGVLDAIESFCANTHSPDCKFTKIINQIFKRHRISLELINGKFTSFNQIITPNMQTREPGLEELLFEADKFYKEGRIFNALEKVWDAFERLKTFYYPTLDKRESLQRIIKEISKENIDRADFFDNEFKGLTKIGNEYRIRHHEKDKKELYDDSFSDYLYNKCLSLISVSLKEISLYR